MGENQDKKLTEYKNGDKTPFGMEIVRILDASRRALVFWDKNDQISYLYDNDELIIDPNIAINKYKTLYSKLSKDIPEKTFKSLYLFLGSCLFNALNADSDEKIDEVFFDIQRKILSIRTPKEIKLVYVLSAIIVCSILSALLSLTFYWTGANIKNWSLVFICAASGTIGSLFSILQRNSELDIDITMRNLYLFMQVLSRAFFGAFAGGILFVSSKANLAFGFAQDNVYSIITLSIISGFSERFIPEMFEKITSKTTNDNT